MEDTSINYHVMSDRLKRISQIHHSELACTLRIIRPYSSIVCSQGCSQGGNVGAKATPTNWRVPLRGSICFIYVKNSDRLLGSVSMYLQTPDDW